MLSRWNNFDTFGTRSHIKPLKQQEELKTNDQLTLENSRVPKYTVLNLIIDSGPCRAIPTGENNFGSIHYRYIILYE